MKRRVLVIGPDNQLNNEIKLHITEEGWAVKTAITRQEGLRKLHTDFPNLIIIDTSETTAELDGWELSRNIRAVSDMPLILIVAQAAEVEQAKELGADGYLLRSFQAEELMASAKTALARRPESLTLRRRDSLRINGDLRLDFDTRQVEVRGQTFDLTAKEFQLLSYLVSNDDGVIPYDELLRVVWGDRKANRTALKAYIWRLRQKIEVDPRNPKNILTRRGVGYHFNSSS